jgi:uncharacterized RDD family membrane protein YckC
MSKLPDEILPSMARMLNSAVKEQKALGQGTEPMSAAEWHAARIKRAEAHAAEMRPVMACLIEGTPPVGAADPGHSWHQGNKLYNQWLDFFGKVEADDPDDAFAVMNSIVETTADRFIAKLGETFKIDKDESRFICALGLAFTDLGTQTHRAAAILAIWYVPAPEGIAAAKVQPWLAAAGLWRRYFAHEMDYAFAHGIYDGFMIAPDLYGRLSVLVFGLFVILALGTRCQTPFERIWGIKLVAVDGTPCSSWQFVMKIASRVGLLFGGRYFLRGYDALFLIIFAVLLSGPLDWVCRTKVVYSRGSTSSEQAEWASAKATTGTTNLPSSATCRICFEGEGEEAGPLFRPCKCDGSIRYVHQSCLAKWRKASPNPLAFSRCEQCQNVYRGGVRVYASAADKAGGWIAVYGLTIAMVVTSLAWAGAECKLYQMAFGSLKARSLVWPEVFIPTTWQDVKMHVAGGLVIRGSQAAAELISKLLSAVTGRKVVFEFSWLYFVKELSASLFNGVLIIGAPYGLYILCTASLKSAEDKVFDPHALPLIEVEDENDTARQASEDEDGNKKRN